MAQGVGSSKLVRFGQDTFGGHLFGAVDYNGPTSYAVGGDAIDPTIFGFGASGTIISLTGSIDQSGGFEAIGRPMQNDVTPWQLVWINVDSGLQVAADFNLSPYTVRLSAIGV